MLCVILSSCAGVSQMQDKLAKATDKTANITEMNFMPISATAEQAVVFNEKTPFYMFEKGKSFYSAISLPEPRQPRFLNVKAYLTGIYLPSAAILIPNFLLLDADKKIIGKFENYRLKSVSDFWKGSYYSSQLALPANAFYIVAYAASEQTPEAKVYSENGTEYVLPLSPAGEFKLSLGEPLPLNYDFSSIIIKDSAEILDTDKVNFYYVKKIDNEVSENNLDNSVKLNRGRGMRISPYEFDRELPLKNVKLTIAGKLQYGAPIQELLNKAYEIEGTINFIPEKNRKYVVKGELNQNYQAVWLEDEESHQVMDKKIEVKSK